MVNSIHSINFWGTQMTLRRTTLGMELLESRALPSGSPWSAFFDPSPAVRADLAKIQTDLQSLHSELVTLAPTLKKDQQALQTAITSAIDNDATVSTAETTLKTDINTWTTTLKADWQAVWGATSSAARVTAITKLKGDLTAAAKAINADHTAVQTAINADAGVQAAEAQLKTDSAPITAGQATLKADYAQLEKDLKAEAGSIFKWI
jgi:hypothetical protein